VADDAVSSEPVSATKFPAIREFNREFSVLWRNCHKWQLRHNTGNFGKTGRISDVRVVESDGISIGWKSNSLRNRTGYFFEQTGKANFGSGNGVPAISVPMPE
jgi:hypothetical protein